MHIGLAARPLSALLRLRSLSNERGVSNARTAETVRPEIVADAHRLKAAGADQETILVFLRERGFNKIDSIKTVRALYGLSMPKAKELIDHSAAWSDRFYSDLQLRQTALRALRDIAAESANDPDALKIEFSEPDETES
jgi:ribosomal protein L7/L12